MLQRAEEEGGEGDDVRTLGGGVSWTYGHGEDPA
jgi:hypothetical protein